MRRSRCVPLVMLGLASALGGCSEEVEVSQDQYASLTDCVKDWGSEQHCKPAPQQGNSGGTFVSYRGPRYYWDRTTGNPVAVLESGVHQQMPGAHPNGSAFSHSIGKLGAGTVSRGGFGHFGFSGRGG